MSRLTSKSVLLPLATLLALTCVPALAECDYPNAPSSMPSGSTASKAEMLAASEVFTQYNTDVTAYLACLKDDTAARSAGANSKMVVQIRSLHSRKHNSAVRELETIIARFNEQLRAFKERA